MEIEFLGTGGAITIPRPGCFCEMCEQARDRGIPYSRSGPCVFIHGPDVLIDTPEEIKEQLNRSGISHVSACFYSHWHPDHVMGRRLWEMNMDWRNWPPEHRHTDIYLPERVADDFRKFLGSWDHLKFFEDNGLVTVHVVRQGESVTVGNTHVTPFPLAEEFMHAFIFESEGKRVLVAPDELIGWQPEPSLGYFDLAIVPMGIIDVNPLTGEQNIPADHPVLEAEATFEETLDILDGLEAGKVVMTHIEELDNLSFDDLQELEAELGGEGANITFAYDGMRIAV